MEKRLYNDVIQNLKQRIRMKNFLFLCVLVTLTTNLFAQDPVKDIKKAARQLATYNLDQAANADKLTEAIQLADASINDPLVKADPTAWQTYGEVFTAAMQNDVQSLVLSPEAPIQQPTAPGKVYNGFKMAAELAQKPYQTKDAMKALAGALQNIYYMGSSLYQAGDFKNAYGAFRATYDAYSLVSKHGENANFDAAEHNKTLYYSALCAQQAGLMPEAKSALQELIKKGNAEAEVYEALIGMETNNPSEVERLLNEGRSKYPSSLNLLYAEINYYLQKGELTSLINKLEEAIKMEPNNVSVYTTLGQVYDKLYQEKSTTDPAAAEDAFNKSLSYYQQALSKDSKNFDAVYSIGALWYNKAAAYSTELNTLANDMTSAGMKKYDAKKVQMDDAFNKALPFFTQAEGLNDKDLNTLIALREIYARQEKYDLSEQYKTRIEALGSK